MKKILLPLLFLVSQLTAAVKDIRIDQILSGTTFSHVTVSPAASSVLTFDSSKVPGTTTLASLLASPPAIGGTTPAAGAFTTLTGTAAASANHSLTTDLDFGTKFIDGSNTARYIYLQGFSSGANAGIVSATGKLSLEANGGSSNIVLRGAAICITDSSFTQDTFLLRDAANTLAQRNGTNAQNLNIYTTYTDASNYKRLRLGSYIGSTPGLFSEGLGTGANPNFYLGSLAGGIIDFVTNGVGRWTINSSGHLLADTDNAYDIGASGATRPRNVYVAGSVLVYGGSANNIGITADAAWGYVQTSGNGTPICFQGSGLWAFGTTTSAGPALKRSSTELQARLADDSNWAALRTDSYYVGAGNNYIYSPASNQIGFTCNNNGVVIFAQGSIKMPVAVNLSMASGTNQRAGDATLSGGTITVNNTTVTANTRIIVTRKTVGGVAGDLSTSLVASTSFTITSANAADTSVVSYLLVEVP